MAWAAAGVIANLAMEPDVPKKLVQAGAMEGLLGLMASPDWLESLQVGWFSAHVAPCPSSCVALLASTGRYA